MAARNSDYQSVSDDDDAQVKSKLLPAGAGQPNHYGTVP